MRSLFWKIFLWFWGAMVLIGLALYFVVLTTRQDPMPLAWRETAAAGASAVATSAVRTYETEGAAAATAELGLAGQQAHGAYWLYDADAHKLAGPADSLHGEIPGDRGPGQGSGPEPGEDPENLGPEHDRGPRPGDLHFPWGGQPPPLLFPDHLRDMRRRAQDADGTVFEPAGNQIVLGHIAVDQHKREFFLVGLVPTPRFGRSLSGPTTQVAGALVALLLSGLVCYGLVNFLTSPLVVLREATRRLAAGELEARTHAGQAKRRDEVADMGRDFDAMADRIETLVKSERQLLGDISHELRSPLTRMTMALALARRHAGEDQVPDEMQGALNRIGRETRRLDALIGQLLELVRLESGDDYSVREIVDLEALTREVVQDADFEAQGQNQNRHVTLVSSEPVRLHGVNDLLLSAVENLVRNALRYTQPGTGVEVALVRTRTETGEIATITVRDHGPGVPEEALAHLFRPFFRVESARDRGSGGVGLGLAITQRAIEAHRGTVTAKNAPGGGLKVTIILPIG